MMAESHRNGSSSSPIHLLVHAMLDGLAAPAMYHINAFAFPKIVLAGHQFQNQFSIHHSPL
jgi:hypothetical protein